MIVKLFLHKPWCLLLFICAGCLHRQGEGMQWTKDKQAIDASLDVIQHQSWVGITPVDARLFQDRVLESISSQNTLPILAVCSQMEGTEEKTICIVVTKSTVYKAVGSGTFKLSTHDYPTHLSVELEQLQKIITERDFVDLSISTNAPMGLGSFRREDGSFQSIFIPFVRYTNLINPSPGLAYMLSHAPDAAVPYSIKNAFIEYFNILSALPEKDSDDSEAHSNK